jgi:hypothetical protein
LLAPLLLGCDFSSSPHAKKHIVLALGALHNKQVQLLKIERLTSLAAFDAWLKSRPAWVGAFDLPFGLPRELVLHFGWPQDWQTCITHYVSLSRAQIRAQFAAFCNARPAGGKFAHRATDRVANSSPSMKWVNPPVAFMLHAGVPILLAAGAHFPGLQSRPVQRGLDVDPSPARVALEAYPGMLARQVLGARSYKADDRVRQTPERLIARKDLINAIEQGSAPLGLRLKLTHAQRDTLADDPSGDALDATLCLMQAAWAQLKHLDGAARYGLPADMDPLEGWIITA